MIETDMETVDWVQEFKLIASGKTMYPVIAVKTADHFYQMAAK